MTAACLEAAALTGQIRWLHAAYRIFGWFTGDNDGAISLIDPDTGACCDGLNENGLNCNRGAESSLAWLQSLAAMRLAPKLPFLAVPQGLAAHPPATAAA